MNKLLLVLAYLLSQVAHFGPFYLVQIRGKELDEDIVAAATLLHFLGFILLVAGAWG